MVRQDMNVYTEILLQIWPGPGVFGVGETSAIEPLKGKGDVPSFLSYCKPRCSYLQLPDLNASAFHFNFSLSVSYRTVEIVLKILSTASVWLVTKITLPLNRHGIDFNSLSQSQPSLIAVGPGFRLALVPLKSPQRMI